MAMAARFCVFLLLVFWALPFSGEFTRRLVVWNVGQGQWVTLLDEHGCWHFDTGGEKAPWREIMALCRGRPNRLSFSHWDWDHLSFASRLRNYVPDVCVDYPPAGKPESARKERLMNGLPACSGKPHYETWVDENGRSSNDKSRVVWWRGVLIPGDSTRKEEKYWIHAFHHLRETKFLVLGHHGSRTSTSKGLLDQMPYLQAAIASARRKKYGHPHPETERELMEYRDPMLTTEEWGTLVFDL
jgi:competence protein ComEC